MNQTTIRLASIAVLLGASSITAFAAETTREDRMDQALQDYRNNPAPKNSEGPMARAEDSMKHGAKKTGSAIKHGAQEAGHAVAEGARKTGHAIHRAGQKMEGSDAPK